MPKIIDIKDAKDEETAKIGIKAGHMVRLAGSFNVPEGFVLTTECFDDFIQDNELKSKIRNIISVTDSDDEEKLQNAANTLQKLVLGSSLSAEILESINEHYQNFLLPKDAPLREIADSDKEPIVVVRASPTEKVDSISLMHVQGTEKLHKSILAIYASLFNAEAVRRFSADWNPDMAIIVQKMIMPYISGYIEKHGEEIVLYACYGLWDKNMIFDRYVVDTDIRSVEVADQKTAYMADANTGKLSKVELNHEKAGSQKLSEKQIHVLIDLFKRTGFDMVEYIIDKDNYYFTQADKAEDQPAQPIISVKASEHTKGEHEGDTGIGSIADAAGVDDAQIEDQVKDRMDHKDQTDDIGQESRVQPADTTGSIVEDTEDKKEDVMMSEEKKEKKENALFSIFNSNRGDKPAVVPTEPERETPSADTAQVQDKPKIHTDTDETSDEIKKTGESEASMASIRGSDENVYVNKEPQAEPTANMPVETQEPSFDQGGEKGEKTPVEDSVQVIDDSDKIFTGGADSSDDGFIDTEKTEVKADTEKTEIVQEKQHPLKREEWINTLRFEHTKLLLNYSAIITSKLKKRYIELFDANPENFNEMLKNVSERAAVPCTEGIVKIHELVKRFTQDHTLITIDELKEAYMCTEKFIREF